MKSPQQKAETARRNGALSKGPITEEGKSHSRRNAITHGRRADVLAMLVPPQSGVLVNEDRQTFYNLYDQNISLYGPTHPGQLALVRELTDHQWANYRHANTRSAILNRALIENYNSVQPLTPGLHDVENTIAAYQAPGVAAALTQIRREYTANTRLIALLERRLAFLQKTWPTESAAVLNSDADRAENLIEIIDPESGPEAGPDAASEQTNENTPQPIENIQNQPAEKVLTLPVRGPITPEMIALYRAHFPGRDLEFEVYDTPEAA